MGLDGCRLISCFLVNYGLDLDFRVVFETVALGMVGLLMGNWGLLAVNWELLGGIVGLLAGIFSLSAEKSRCSE